jgi:hypothetical protein
VSRIYEGEEQTDGDRICTGANNCARDSRDLGCGRRKQDAAIGIQPFAQAKAPYLRNEWLRFLEQQIVKLWARLPANFDDVFEARGRHESDAPAFSLKQSVSADRGPTDEFEARQAYGEFPESIQRKNDRLGWFARSGRNLQNFKASAAKKNTIGERAAGIKRDAHEAGDCIAS